MLAQVYYDYPPIVRLFKKNLWVADLPLDDTTPSEADRSLHLLGLYRKEKWHKREWGLESRVSIRNVIPRKEAWLYRNPKALRSVRKGLREAAEGKLEKMKK